MEFGDILYLILIIGVMFFGFFKELKKKSKETADQGSPEVKDLGDVFREIFQTEHKTQAPPPVPASQNRKKTMPPVPMQSGRRVFQSSMDLVTDFEGESSLKGHKFESHLMEVESIDEGAEVTHPILEHLTGEHSSDEVRKAIVYSEILKRRY